MDDFLTWDSLKRCYCARTPQWRNSCSSVLEFERHSASFDKNRGTHSFGSHK
jgi:hypothetical protein